MKSIISVAITAVDVQLTCALYHLQIYLATTVTQLVTQGACLNLFSSSKMIKEQTSSSFIIKAKGGWHWVKARLKDRGSINTEINTKSFQRTTEFRKQCILEMFQLLALGDVFSKHKGHVPIQIFMWLTRKKKKKHVKEMFFKTVGTNSPRQINNSASRQQHKVISSVSI